MKNEKARYLIDSVHQRPQVRVGRKECRLKMKDSSASEVRTKAVSEVKLKSRRERNLYDTKTTRKGSNAQTRPLAASSLVK